MRKFLLNLSILVLVLVSVANVKGSTLALWNFDDNEPGYDAYVGQRLVDSSGNGRDAYVSAGTPSFWISDPCYGIGSALNRATGEKVRFVPGHDFGDGGPVAGTAIGDWAADASFTIEAVVRFPVGNLSSKISCIASKMGLAGSKAPQWWFRVETSGKLRFLIRDSFGGGVGDANQNQEVSVMATSGNAYDGEWHHVAAIRDYYNGTIRVYLDYVQVGIANDSTGCCNFANDGDFEIGSFNTGNTRDFIGSMDLCRVSDAALSTSEFIQKSLPLLASAPSPADKAYNVAISSVTLGWTPASGSGVILSSQTVQVATDAEFDNVIQTFNLNGTANSAYLTPIVQNRRYYWRVNFAGTDNGTPFSQIGFPWYFQTVDANTSVAGYWKFDSQMPGTNIDVNDQIIDSSGNNRDLLVLGEPVQEFGEANYVNPCANYGSGASYEGYEDNQLDLISGYPFGGGSDMAGSGIVIPSEGSFTVEAVVKFAADITNYNGIAHDGISDEESYWYKDQVPQWWFRVDNSGKLRFFVQSSYGTSESNSITGVTNIYDGQWHHVAAVREASVNKIKLYVDYLLNKDGNDITGEMNPSGRMVVAGFYGTESRNFKGDMDFVKITRAALTPSEFVQSFALPTNPNPADGVGSITPTYVFSWTPIAGATITSQTVKIATDPYMQNIVQSVPASGNSAVVTNLAYNTTYYWRVDTVGSDTNGSFNRQGTIWSFSTQSCALTVEMGNLYDEDCVIDFKDFAILANNWLVSAYE